MDPKSHHDPESRPWSAFRRQRLPHPLTYYQAEGIKLSCRGQKWRSAICPFHDDHKPSLRIDITSGGFKCMACATKGGDVLEFHRLRHGLSFVRAAKKLGAWEEPVSFAVPETAKEGARRLSGRVRALGYKPKALYIYRDAQGRELYCKYRLDHPTNEKVIRPMHRIGFSYVNREPEFLNGKPIYGLELLKARPVDTCEGEKCADALRKRGILAVTSGGSSSAATADWKPPLDGT